MNNVNHFPSSVNSSIIEKWIEKKENKCEREYGKNKQGKGHLHVPFLQHVDVQVVEQIVKVGRVI